MQRMLSPKDIQKIFGCSRNKTYQLIETKGFPRIKVGKQYYIPEIDLEKWIEKNKGNDIRI